MTLRGGAPAPTVDRVALSKAMDHLSAAACMAREGDRDTVSRLLALARVSAARAFPAGSREAKAFAVILAAIGGGQ